MALGDITPLGSAVEFDTADYEYGKFYKIDSTHFLFLWAGPGQDGFARVFSIDGSGNIAGIGTALEYDTSRGTWNDAIQIDSSHFLVVYEGAGQDGFAVVLTVNLTTFAVTAAGSALEFDTTNCQMPQVQQIDSTHYLVTWRGPSNNLLAQVLEVNTGTWAVSALGSPLTVNSEGGSITLDANDLVKLNTNHFLAVYSSLNSDGYARVLEVNTGTWAVTVVGTALEYDPANASSVSAYAFSSSRVVVYNYNSDVSNTIIYVLDVNNSTWEVTAFDSDVLDDIYITGRLAYLTNNIYALVAANLTDTAAQLVTFEKDATSAGALTKYEEQSLGVGTAATLNLRIAAFTSSRVLVAWQDPTSGDGFMQAFDVDVGASGTSSINKLAGVSHDNIKRAAGIAEANIKKVSGVSNS